MKINLQNAGKRFNREWIFRQATLEFSSGKAYVITGPNGSGKSTLLQSIAGMLQLSEGNITYQIKDQSIAPEAAYQYLSFCSPALEVMEEMTMEEFFSFHRRFKDFLTTFNAKKIIETIGLQAAAHKQIRYFSSGMKQRVKLAQAIFFNTPMVLLDEPCSNLDVNGIALYHHLMHTYCNDRLVIVCSNDEVEYNFCSEIISVTAFK